MSRLVSLSDGLQANKKRRTTGLAPSFAAVFGVKCSPKSLMSTNDRQANKNHAFDKQSVVTH